jgi:hypothetical protein
MPTYDYYCPANARTLEVWHGMNESLATWGELCVRAQIDPGDTPLDSPIERLSTGGNIISARGEATSMPLMPCGQTQCQCAWTDH